MVLHGEYRAPFLPVLYLPNDSRPEPIHRGEEKQKPHPNSGGGEAGRRRSGFYRNVSLKTPPVRAGRKSSSVEVAEINLVFTHPCEGVDTLIAVENLEM